MSALTPEERHERLEELLRRRTHGQGCGCSYCVLNRETIREAYEAGRSAMREEAAKAAEEHRTSTGRFAWISVSIAAAIRALKP